MESNISSPEQEQGQSVITQLCQKPGCFELATQNYNDGSYYLGCCPSHSNHANYIKKYVTDNSHFPKTCQYRMANGELCSEATYPGSRFCCLDHRNAYVSENKHSKNLSRDCGRGTWKDPK